MNTEKSTMRYNAEVFLRMCMYSTESLEAMTDAEVQELCQYEENLLFSNVTEFDPKEIK